MATPQVFEYSEASEIAQFMGLKNWKRVNDIELVETVEEGLPVATAQTIVRKIDPRGQFVDVHQIIPKATFYRKKESNQALTRDQSEKVLGLSKVFVEVLRIYKGDTEKAAMFLTNKHPLLGNRSPMDLSISSTAGADLVLDLLSRADAGVAV